MKLGATQQSIIGCLKEKRGWSAGCGWIWGTYSETVRVLESLVRRGIVQKEEEVSKHGHIYTRYSLTEKKD
jgi:hypothetical protein